MARLFCLSLGGIDEKTSEINSRFSYARKQDISGVELIFASKDELYSSRLSEENLSWLKSLKYVSIHAPFKLVSKSHDQLEVARQLDILSDIYHKINAKNLIIHPNEMPEIDLIRRYDFSISTENLRPGSRVPISILERILSRYRIKLCLDVAHAYLWSKHETGRLIDAFKQEISEVHFSGTCRKVTHVSLRTVSSEFIYSIQRVRELDVPIVIEEDMRGKGPDFVREEIQYIKGLFE